MQYSIYFQDLALGIFRCWGRLAISQNRTCCPMSSLGLYIYIYIYIYMRKIRGKVNKAKLWQLIQKQYFIFTLSVSVYPLIQLIFLILSDLPNLPFLHLYTYIHICTYIHILIYVHISSSCRAVSRDLPYPLSAPVSIIHRSGRSSRPHPVSA